ILYIMEELPVSVSCRGTAHVTPGVEDVTMMYLDFSRQRSAVVLNSWLDPRKVREMTIVGSTRMLVYDGVAPPEKLKIFDARGVVLPRPGHESGAQWGSADCAGRGSRPQRAHLRFCEFVWLRNRR